MMYIILSIVVYLTACKLLDLDDTDDNKIQQPVFSAHTDPPQDPNPHNKSTDR